MVFCPCPLGGGTPLLCLIHATEVYEDLRVPLHTEIAIRKWSPIALENGVPHGSFPGPLILKSYD